MNAEDSPEASDTRGATAIWYRFPNSDHRRKRRSSWRSLQSGGIPVVEGGRCNPKAPAQVLVPRNRLAEAHRLIASARGFSSSATSLERPAERERPSLVTAITWVLAIGMAIYVVVQAGRSIYGLAANWFR